MGKHNYSIMYIDKVFRDTTYITLDDGVKIRVYDSASKHSYDEEKTIVFLHGSPGQINNWKYQIRFFEDRYRVIAYDQRGYGLSDKPLVVSLGDYLRDLDTLIDRLDINRDSLYLIGHSFGGLVAQEYASKRDVRGLVLVSTVLKIKPDLLDYIVWYLPPILWRRIFFTENVLTRRIYRNLFFSKATDKEIFKEFIYDNREYLENAPSHMFRYLKFFKGYDARECVNKIDIPTLIIVGRDDKVTPPEDSEVIHSLIGILGFTSWMMPAIYYSMRSPWR